MAVPRQWELRPRWRRIRSDCRVLGNGDRWLVRVHAANGPETVVQLGDDAGSTHEMVSEGEYGSASPAAHERKG